MTHPKLNELTAHCAKAEAKALTTRASMSSLNQRSEALQARAKANEAEQAAIRADMARIRAGRAVTSRAGTIEQRTAALIQKDAEVLRGLSDWQTDCAALTASLKHDAADSAAMLARFNAVRDGHEGLLNFARHLKAQGLDVTDLERDPKWAHRVAEPNWVGVRAAFAELDAGPLT